VIRRYVLALVIGFAGAAVFFAGWHLVNDHAALHELVQIEIARQRAVHRPPTEAPRAPGS